MSNERRAFIKTVGSAAAAVAATSGVTAEAAAPAQQSRSVDRALWITWYDLPEAGREAYLSWLHQEYMPTLLKRPGFVSAAHYATVYRGTMSTMRRGGAKKDPRLDPSVPTGDRYAKRSVAKRPGPWLGPWVKLLYHG